jgi:DNA-binding XRE family transcriptional regulator
MNQDSSKSVNSNDIDGLTISILSKIKDNVREVISENLSQYLHSVNKVYNAELSDTINDSNNFFETIFHQVLYCTIPQILSEESTSSEESQDIYTAISNKIKLYIKKNQSSLLFEFQPFESIPASDIMLSSINLQLKKEEVWQKNENGIACSQHKDKNNPRNYIEHYISTPGDITLLPWNEAQQIIDKFGFNSAKLHLIFAAYAMKQSKPWESLFVLNASELTKEMGWDKRTDLPKHQKLLEIAKTAFALDCLLVKTVWIEGRNKKGGINASTPVGRMWNITIVPSGQMNVSGKIEKPDEINIVIQPGTWTRHFLNRAGEESREALYQFSFLAQEVLKIDPYHDELALRLAIYLTLNSRFRLNGDYTVQELLEIALPKISIDKARLDSRRAYDLKQRWDVAIILLLKLGWQVTFDPETYPECLRPNSQEKKPRGYLNKLLNAKLYVKPPVYVPELRPSEVKTKVKRLKPKAKDKAPQDIKLTSSQVREARIAKGWSQAKLANLLGVSQRLVSMIELGQHAIAPRLVEKIRAFLEL